MVVDKRAPVTVAKYAGARMDEAISIQTGAPLMACSDFSSLDSHPHPSCCPRHSHHSTFCHRLGVRRHVHAARISEDSWNTEAAVVVREDVGLRPFPDRFIVKRTGARVSRRIDGHLDGRGAVLFASHAPVESDPLGRR